MEDRFDQDGFGKALADAGFTVQRSQTLFGSFAWFIADKADASGAS